MANRRRISEKKIARICYYLAKTENTNTEIAQLVDVSVSVVSTINREKGIRLYNGNRASWTSGSEKNTDGGRA